MPHFLMRCRINATARERIMIPAYSRAGDRLNGNTESSPAHHAQERNAVKKAERSTSHLCVPLCLFLLPSSRQIRMPLFFPDIRYPPFYRRRSSGVSPSFHMFPAPSIVTILQNSCARNLSLRHASLFFRSLHGFSSTSLQIISQALFSSLTRHVMT